MLKLNLQQLLRPVIALWLSAALLGTATGCPTRYDEDAAEKLTMKRSVTYLYLPRETPYFTAITTAQLQWVIEHSKEWEAFEGSVIDTCENAAEADAGGDYWILLDGRWSLEYRGKRMLAGHADPGKWFAGSVSNGSSYRLVAMEHSYVMKITHSDMQDMHDNGFSFAAHLEAGRKYYRTLFGTTSVTTP